jgi:transglutaminase-like putative cysteine protease
LELDVRHIFSLAVLFGVAFFAQPGFAQKIEKYIRIAPADDWVKPQTPPQAAFALAKNRDTAYQLVAYQTRMSKTGKASYNHFAITLNTAKGVESNASISITFDPSFQNIVFHDVSIIRDGKRTSRLSFSAMELYRAEKDRDRLIFNKDLQLTMILPDIRIGDTLDYAYTVYGKNPAWGSHVYDSTQLQFSLPVQSFYNRVVLGYDLKVSERAHAGGESPMVTQSKRGREYVWSSRNLKALDVDDDRPAWHYGYPAYEVSSFENWGEVGRFFTPYYVPPKRLPAELERAIETIKEKSDDPKVRTREALDYVQREIRYLGIELGKGGYIPRPPELVLKRRFGDCKDVTLLLTSMLSAMDIKATPLLVSSTLRAGVDAMLPNYGAFDHVIVKVDLQGRSYFLDPTRDRQFGDLDNLEQGLFGKGLPVSKNSSGLIDITPPSHAWRKDFYDTYDMVSSADDVTFTTELNYYGSEADDVVDWLKRDGEKGVGDALLKYYQDHYPSITIKTPLSSTRVEAKSKVTLLAAFTIPSAWAKDEENKNKQFTAKPLEINAEFPNFDGTTRTSPFKLEHPVRSRQTLKFLVDDSWAFNDETFLIDNKSFRYAKNATFKDNVYTETYTYDTKADFISSANFAKTMKGISTAQDNLGVVLQISTETTTPSILSTLFTETNILIFYYSWFAFATLLALAIVFKTRNSDAKWREEGLFYPVRLRKFILLSALTLGMYGVYWTYKNWLWIKTVLKEDLSPGWRTFFAGFTNFSLFLRLTHEQDKGYAGFRFFAIPLALLVISSNVFNRVAMRMDETPVWMDVLVLFSFLTLVPVVMQVKKMNATHQNVIKRNSAYSWRSYGAILLYLPLTALAYLGLAMGIAGLF